MKNEQIIKDFSKLLEDTKHREDILDILRELPKDFPEEEYSLEKLYDKYYSLLKPGLSDEEYIDILILGSSELVTQFSPKWDYIAGRFYALKIRKLVEVFEKENNITSLYDKIQFGIDKNIYNKDLNIYSKEEIDMFEKELSFDRDKLFNYSGLDLIEKRYLARYKSELFEHVQEWFMLVSLHIGTAETKYMKEKSKEELEDRNKFVLDLYYLLSNLKVTLATPTLSNARTTFPQLSSCFIDSVPDSLTGIYESLTNFAQVSKHGGGMGMYFGHVRSSGSDIRGVKGAAGGLTGWIRLANDTAVAVDQLGVRQGAVAVYADLWHKDIREFLQLRTNNGDDRKKAHDVFPALSVPNLFWRLAENERNTANWYLFDPHEVKQVMGFSLEDFYGKEWEEKYKLCIEEEKLSREVISVKDMIRLILKPMVETGTPFVFNRDLANEMNPNKHKGMIYSSNLCTEIMQNNSPIKHLPDRTVIEDGKVKVVKESEPGDFVVCNLASLVLGRINLQDKEELELILNTVVRALDNVIDINFYPVKYAEITNKKYRAIGIGTSGYHHALVKEGITFSSDKHLEFMDKVYEDINYFAIKASSDLSKSRGHYEHFEGSDWDNGKYFELRDYNSDRWLDLKDKVNVDGLRNGYLMAIAPTSSTSIIAGTTAGIDPVHKTYYLEEKKGSIMPRVAPDITTENFWIYEGGAHQIEQEWVVKAAGMRQRHLDQSQSLNLFITPGKQTLGDILKLLIQANKEGVKTIYYIRSQALDVDECESCSA